MYLRTYSPYLDSLFTRCSKSQNTIGVNLLGTHSTVDHTCYHSCLTYIPSPLPDLTMFTHKVPSHVRSISVNWLVSILVRLETVIVWHVPFYNIGGRLIKKKE